MDDRERSEVFDRWLRQLRSVVGKARPELVSYPSEDARRYYLMGVEDAKWSILTAYRSSDK